MTDEPEAPETSRIVLLSKDRVISKIVREGGTLTEDHAWIMSTPVPGTILNTWEIYHKVQIVLSRADSGNYQIFRSDNLITYSLVHDHAHALPVHDMFLVNDGYMLFCADDGWWGTTDTGISWHEIAFDVIPDDEEVPEFASWEEMPYVYPDPDPLVEVPELDWPDVPPLDGFEAYVTDPITHSLCVIPVSDSEWRLAAYADDQKIYYVDYPDGLWIEAYDSSDLWNGRRYSAFAGSAVGVIAGIGPYLMRTSAEDLAAWQQIQEVDGIIKAIRISDLSNHPIFFIVLERTDGDHIYSSSDLCDSVVEEVGTRIDPNVSIESIVPTLGNTNRTTFAVMGRRSTDGPINIRVIEK